jgi:hypothetical protein
MSLYAIVNVSSKGLWPRDQDVTLVRAESREAIIQAILYKQNDFLQKRLLPCHVYLRGIIRAWRVKHKITTLAQEQSEEPGFEVYKGDRDASLSLKKIIAKILDLIDSGECNDGGFYTAIYAVEEPYLLHD